MGMVVQFPTRKGGCFSMEMRGGLVRFAAKRPGIHPIEFGKEPDGSEFCRLGSGITVGWDQEHRLILTDTASGYVDRGPFNSLDDVCLLIDYLTA